MLSSQILHRITISHNHNYTKRLTSAIADAKPLSFFLKQAGAPRDLDLEPQVGVRTAGAPSPSPTVPKNIKFHLKTYGCQMNVSDSEIVRSVLTNDDMNSYSEVDSELEADVLLTNTCAIRDGAEAKIWHRLSHLNSLNDHTSKNYSPPPTPPNPQQINKKKKNKRIVGVLGCMAERLKDKMFEEGNVDLIAGPDAYRSLPQLIDSLVNTSSNDMRAANTQLSLEETYADVSPVRHEDNPSAFVSIMRGCNNMCSYCIVPFTRGRERSRDHTTIPMRTVVFPS